MASHWAHDVAATSQQRRIPSGMIYCRSGNIREVLIFAKWTNSRIQKFCTNYYYNSATKKNINSRILNFVKNRKVRARENLPDLQLNIDHGDTCSGRA